MQNLELKLMCDEIENELGREFESINDFIFKNPEISSEEYISSNYLVDIMKKCGFKVTFPYCGFDTAFLAEFGDEKGPTIAFLAEYDALPGYTEDRVPGHTCGHNWIAAATTGVSIVLSKIVKKTGGKIILIGTPAEETLGSKVDMIKEGAFENIDIVLQPHLESFNDINCKALALDAIEFNYTGKATHAASYPHEGINALDAVQLMFAGVNALRQQLKSDVKISGIVTEGGAAPNIIPQKATCRYYIRSTSREYLDLVSQKIINCARGAELMTGAIMEYTYFENSFEDILNVPLLQDTLRRNMVALGIDNFCDSSVAPSGSSDIGNVSKVCPTMYFEVDIESDRTFYTHDEIALDYVNSEYAYAKLHQVIKIMARTAIDLLLDHKLIEEIQKTHRMLRSLN
jgi:amidohydrolase